VSGGVGGATAGTLTFMVGGPEQAFIRAESILQKMGKTIVQAGGAGNGQAAKICNNMILGISMIAVSEGFALAEKLGLEHQKLFDIASKSSGQCWAMTSYCPVAGPVPTSPANRDYQAGFTAAMMLKDLRLAQEAAKASGAKTPLGREAATLYEHFVDSGISKKGSVDFSGIYLSVRS
jgi:3-hydroxyisobutyrate dehydrogenase